jgi:nitrite reductase (NADH) large subunit
LPRQLDNEAASVLQSTLVEAGIELRTRAAIERIEPAGDGLAIVLKDGEVFRAGVVVAAVGARANDEAARDAGLRCHPRGGVEVDTYLRTSDPHVFAIGECGSHQAVPHGLVAPGYVMANILAERLMGQRGKLEPQSAVTRLKLDLTEVTVVGDPIGVRPDRELVFRNKGVYRRLSFKKNRIVAAICIGTWKELAEVQTAAAAGHKIPKQARALFESEGNLGLAKADAGVASWPDDAIVCQCAFVTCGALRKAALTCPDVDALARATGASSLCGSCRPLLVTVSGTARTAPPDRRARLFTAAAIAALGLCALTLLMPRVPVATSISQQGLARLWIEPLFKQVSGLVLVSVVLVGLLFSLRKRVERFRLSSYKSLRVLHAALGALALIGLFAHTGFRLGQNLNLALTVVFLVSALSGALAGVSKALIPEQRKNLKLAAGYVERAHEITFWALPALVLFHALKTYYF